MSATVTAFAFSPLRLRLRFGSSLRGKPSWLRHHARARRSGLPYPSAPFAPVRPAPERITPRCCRLIVTAWGWHRFSASSPAVVHLRFAPDHFFRLRLRSPMPEERGHGERGGDEEPYRNPSPRPPPAILCGRGSRLHVCEMFYLIRRRHPPRRMLTRSGSRLFNASRSLLQREAATAPEVSDTVAAGWLAFGIAKITASPSDNIPLCIVVRYAATARYAARPPGLHNECYPTCRLLWVAAHDWFHPAGRRLCRLGQVEYMGRFVLMSGVSTGNRT